MGEPRKTVTIRRWGCLADHGNIPHKLEEFVAALQAALDEVPAEHKHTAEVDCDPEHEYGESYAAVRVTYDRPMTEEEIAAEEAEERRRAIRRMRIAEREVAIMRERLGMEI
ncbi:hypothetical protein CN090_04530 [Sinorhizobium meliloti]|uniref:hypothetical protein n=1 Tax=Rhizobium meliloti TaxID=382 RepID=UPI000FDC540C|nr:hypothetical protein [Sinorhizobium meliloti]RVO55187.1 hypothetical protein CN090_04530 [Sinorhizobium meliloti]